MPYFDTWEEFEKHAEALFQAEPDRTRCSIKYRHVDGQIVCKVTDDKACLKFRTDQLQDVKKIEKFNATLMRAMLNKHDA